MVFLDVYCFSPPHLYLLQACSTSSSNVFFISFVVELNWSRYHHVLCVFVFITSECTNRFSCDCFAPPPETNRTLLQVQINKHIYKKCSVFIWLKKLQLYAWGCYNLYLPWDTITWFIGCFHYFQLHIPNGPGQVGTSMAFL